MYVLYAVVDDKMSILFNLENVFFSLFVLTVEWTIVNPPIIWKDSNIVVCYCQTKH